MNTNNNGYIREYNRYRKLDSLRPGLVDSLAEHAINAGIEKSGNIQGWQVHYGYNSLIFSMEEAATKNAAKHLFCKENNIPPNKQNLLTVSPLYESVYSELTEESNVKEVFNSIKAGQEYEIEYKRTSNNDSISKVKLKAGRKSLSKKYNTNTIAFTRVDNPNTAKWYLRLDMRKTPPRLSMSITDSPVFLVSIDGKKILKENVTYGNSVPSFDQIRSGKRYVVKFSGSSTGYLPREIIGIAGQKKSLRDQLNAINVEYFEIGSIFLARYTRLVARDGMVTVILRSVPTNLDLSKVKPLQNINLGIGTQKDRNKSVVAMTQRPTVERIEGFTKTETIPLDFKDSSFRGRRIELERVTEVFLKVSDINGMAGQSIKAVAESASPLNEKLDPVGKEDADIDNDGDTDNSDEYLRKRREKIAKAIKSKKRKTSV